MLRIKFYVNNVLMSNKKLGNILDFGKWSKIKKEKIDTSYKTVGSNFEALCTFSHFDMVNWVLDSDCDFHLILGDNIHCQNLVTAFTQNLYEIFPRHLPLCMKLWQHLPAIVRDNDPTTPQYHLEVLVA